MSYPIDIREEAGVRTLHFGSDWIQGAMRIARPWNLELEYTREMMLALLWMESPRRILIVGMGAASLVKFLYRHCPDAHLTVVEIESDVVAAARQFFKLPDDPERIHIVIGDGAAYMQENRKKYDLIFIDGFDENARSGGLDTLPFYQACRARLSSSGMLAINLLTSNRRFNGNVGRIAEAFDDRVLVLPSCESGNAIAFATTGDTVQTALGDLKEEARDFKDATGVNLLPTLSRLEQSHGCLGGILQL